jgi:hypothetical protein
VKLLFVKVAIVAAVVTAALVSVWSIRSRLAERRVEAISQSILAKYQGDAPIGTPRVVVQEVLDSRKLPYFDNSVREIDVKIGEHRGDGILCDRWVIYIKFDFTLGGGQSSPLPSDPVTDIRLVRIGQCL